MIRRFDFDPHDFLMAGGLALFSAVLISASLYFNGFDISHAASIGLLVGAFVGFALLSEIYTTFRFLCALITAVLAIKISLYAGFTLPVMIAVTGLSAILGYFARKWAHAILNGI